MQQNLCPLRRPRVFCCFRSLCHLSAMELSCADYERSRTCRILLFGTPKHRESRLWRRAGRVDSPCSTPLKRGKGVIGGWERYVGAVSLGAFAGTFTNGGFRDSYVQRSLLLGEPWENRFPKGVSGEDGPRTRSVDTPRGQPG